MKADVSFLKSTLGKMRLMSQLRGRVTLCGTFRELVRYAIINNPESLSARSHTAFRSMSGLRRRMFLRGKVRRGTCRPCFLCTHRRYNEPAVNERGSLKVENVMNSWMIVEFLSLGVNFLYNGVRGIKCRAFSLSRSKASVLATM